MILRRFIVPETGCASYLFGCTSKGQVGVVDPHVELVEDYIEAAAAAGARIAQVFDTHVHADHPCDCRKARPWTSTSSPSGTARRSC